MPTYTILGKKVTTQQELTDAQIDEIASEMAPAAPVETASPVNPTAESPSILDQLKRQVGLTGRIAVEGASMPINALADFASGAYNVGANLLGSESRMPYLSQQQSQGLTAAGVPQAETGIERAVQAGGQAMMGTGVQGALAAASKVKSLAPLAQNMAQQVPAAAAGGTAAEPISSYVQDVTGSPMAAIVAGMAVGHMAGGVGAKAGTKAEKAIKAKMVDAQGKPLYPETQPITIEDVKRRAQQSYAKMESMGVSAKPLSVLNMVDSIEGGLSKANFNPQMDAHKPVAQLLEQFRVMTGTSRVPFTKLEQMRSAATDLSKAPDANTRRLAGVVVSGIDDYMSGMTPKDLIAGVSKGPEAVKAVMDARKDWKSQARAQVLEDVLDVAALRAENPKASEADLIRNGLTNLAANKNKMRLFSTDEQNAIKETLRQKNYDPLLTLLSKFNPERGGMGTSLLGGGTLAAIGGQTAFAAPAIGLAGAGYATDRLYGGIKSRAAKSLVSDVLTGNTEIPKDFRWRGMLSGIPQQ